MVTGSRRVPRLEAVIARALVAAWREPGVPPPRTRPWWDVALVAALFPATVLEVLARTDVPWAAYSSLLATVSVLAVLWRARHPLGMVLVGYGAQTAAGVGPALAGLEYGVPYTTSVVLLLPYSLSRWGSGRQISAGVAFLLAAHFLREPLYGSTTTENLIGAGFLLFPAALGAAVRFWGSTRRREIEQVRSRERARLARELHDTVAHHVSGIVIQAQAGRVVAARDPGAALEALTVIERTATLTLDEMRSLVGVLRDGEPAERAPASGAADLVRLAAAAAQGARVKVDISGDTADLSSPVSAAVYRVAQEAVTNARWHAQGATLVEVRVRGERDAVHVEVLDDGTGSSAVPSSARGRGSGYGLVGMRERVEVLGGHLEAGPLPEGGWAVTATIPRSVPL